MSQARPQTILFADVSGSTRLFETRGDVEARRLIAAVLDAMGKVARMYGGRVVKTIGDEVMVTLPTAVDGLLASCDMQRKIERDPAFALENLAVRIGFHHGPTLEEDDGDVYGDAVNVAARMAALAKREQIVTTAATVAAATGAGGPQRLPETRSLGRTRVSGKLLPIEIHDVVWQEDTSGMTMVQSAIRMGGAAEPAGARLTLRHRGKLIELTECGIL